SLDERLLGPEVQRLGGVLAGERAAVQLEVQLADPDRGVGQLGARVVEEGIRMLPLHLRGALQRRHALCLARHLAGRAATAVSPAAWRDRHGRLAILPELPAGLCDL